MPDIFQIFEEIQVIFFNIQDDADFREKMKKAVGIFTGFCNKCPEFPTRIFPPIAFRIPPTDMVGSRSPARRMCEIIEVVVVLPWVPDTAMGVRNFS